jgi:hypothetical protein
VERTDGVALKAATTGRSSQLPDQQPFRPAAAVLPADGRGAQRRRRKLGRSRRGTRASTFRVDWSENRVTDSYDFDTLSFLGVLGGVKYDPIAYTVLDPSQPTAALRRGGGYFDVTNKALRLAETIDLASLASATARSRLLLSNQISGGTEPWGNCNPTRSPCAILPARRRQRLRADGLRRPALSVPGRIQLHISGGASRATTAWWTAMEPLSFLRYNIWERSHFYADPQAMTGELACATYDTTEAPTGDPNADPNRDVRAVGRNRRRVPGAGAGSRRDVYKQQMHPAVRRAQAADHPLGTSPATPRSSTRPTGRSRSGTWP